MTGLIDHPAPVRLIPAEPRPGPGTRSLHPPGLRLFRVSLPSGDGGHGGGCGRGHCGARGVRPRLLQTRPPHLQVGQHWSLRCSWCFEQAVDRDPGGWSVCPGSAAGLDPDRAAALRHLKLHRSELRAQLPRRPDQRLRPRHIQSREQRPRQKTKVLLMTTLSSFMIISLLFHSHNKYSCVSSAKDSKKLRASMRTFLTTL